MAPINRFVSPVVYDYKSQFIPTELPFDAMSKALATKQGKQDEAIAQERSLLNLKAAGIDTVQFPTGEIMRLDEKLKAQEKIDRYNQKIIDLSNQPIDRTAQGYVGQIRDLRNEHIKLSSEMSRLKEREDAYGKLTEGLGKAKNINKAPWLTDAYMDQTTQILQDKTFVPSSSVNYGDFVDREKLMRDAIGQMETYKTAYAGPDQHGYIKSGTHEYRTANDIEYASIMAMKNNGILDDLQKEADWLDKYGKAFSSAEEKEQFMNDKAKSLISEMKSLYSTDKRTAGASGDSTWQYLDKKKESDALRFTPGVAVGTTDSTKIPALTDAIDFITGKNTNLQNTIQAAQNDVALKADQLSKGIISKPEYDAAVNNLQKLSLEKATAEDIVNKEVTNLRNSNSYKSKQVELLDKVKKYISPAYTGNDPFQLLKTENDRKQFIKDPYVRSALNELGLNFAASSRDLVEAEQKLNTYLKDPQNLNQFNNALVKQFENKELKNLMIERGAQITYPVVTINPAEQANWPLLGSLNSTLATNPQSFVVKLNEEEIDPTILNYQDPKKSLYSVHYDSTNPNGFFLQSKIVDDKALTRIATQNLIKKAEAGGINIATLNNKDRNEAIGQELALLKSKGNMVQIDMDRNNQFGVKLATQIVEDPNADEEAKRMMSQFLLKDAQSLFTQESTYSLLQPNEAQVFKINAINPVTKQPDTYLVKITKGPNGNAGYAETMQPIRDANGNLVEYQSFTDNQGNSKREHFTNFNAYINSLIPKK